MSRKKPAGRQDQSVRKKVDWQALEIVHPQAGGIDVGGSELWVSVHPSYLLRLPDEDAKAQEYERFVADLKMAAAYLRKSADAA